MSSLRSGRLITRFAQTRFAADPPLRSLFDTLAFAHKKLRRNGKANMILFRQLPCRCRHSLRVLPPPSPGIRCVKKPYSNFFISLLVPPSGGMEVYLLKQKGPAKGATIDIDIEVYSKSFRKASIRFRPSFIFSMEVA